MPTWRPPPASRRPCSRAMRLAAASRSAVTQMTWSMRVLAAAVGDALGGELERDADLARLQAGVLVQVHVLLAQRVDHVERALLGRFVEAPLDPHVLVRVLGVGDQQRGLAVALDVLGPP